MKLSTVSLTSVLLTSANALSFSSNTSTGYTSKTTGWDMTGMAPEIIRIEGQTRHTIAFQDRSKNTVQIAMKSPNDRPIQSEVNLWLGPDYTPYSLKCKSENGNEYPIQTLIGTKGYAVNVELKNTGAYNFPINTAASYAIGDLEESVAGIVNENQGNTYIDGGAIRMYPFSAKVDQLQILMKTDGNQLKAKIELLNGPNNVKQEYEVYASSGDVTSLFLVFDTPGSGNSIRVKNLATQEYPLDFYWRASKTGTGDDVNGGGAPKTMWN